MLSGPIVVFLPNFYVTSLGLSLGTVGLIFFCARLVDGASDLAVGLASDRTRTRWGRRLPWIAVAAPLLGLMIYLVCLPPRGAGPAYLVACLISLYVAWTAVQIPYTAWGAAISRDYVERNRVFGFREGCTIVGSLLTVALPFFVTGVPSPPLADVVRIVGLGAIVILFLTVPIAIIFGPPAHEPQTRSEAPIREIWALRRNRPFVRVMILALVATTALMIFTAGVLFLLNDALGLKAAFLQLIMVQQVALFASVPLVVGAANRVGKHTTLALGFSGLIAGFVLLALLPGKLFVATAAVLALVGCSAGAIFILLPALAADSIDYGALLLGRGEAGLYMSVFSVVSKIATALGVGLGLPLLQAAGFDPAHGSALSSRRAIDIVALGVPILLLTAAIVMAWSYPLDRRRHGVVVRRLAQLDARAVDDDGLSRPRRQAPPDALVQTAAEIGSPT